MNYKYKLGDKFITLVKNDRETHEIGDILTIIHVDEDESIQPYGLTKNNDDKTLWWFSESAIEEFLVPADSLSDHDTFYLMVAGRLPGRIHYHLSVDDTDTLIRRNPEELIGKIDDWKIHYYYWKQTAS